MWEGAFVTAHIHSVRPFESLCKMENAPTVKFFTTPGQGR